MASGNYSLGSQFSHYQTNLFDLTQQINYLSAQVFQKQSENALLEQSITQINQKIRQIQYIEAQNHHQERQIQREDLSFEKKQKKTVKSSKNVDGILLDQKYNIQSKINSDKKSKSNREHKKYSCPYQKCQRIYKSSFSLNLHIKTYHNGGCKRQREYYASIILEAQDKRLEMPKIPINLPPKFLEDFRSSFEYMKIYKM